MAYSRVWEGLLEGLKEPITGFGGTYQRDWSGLLEGLEWHIKGFDEAY